MSTMEIALLIIGVIIFALSFIIPDKKNSSDQTGVDPETVKEMLENEFEGVKLKVNKACDDTVDYSVDKAERQLERVSNEKIMALSEYADTIMGGIDKSHQELLFMYDMLNDKQTDLKNTVRKAEATAKEVEVIENPTPAPETIVYTAPVMVQQVTEGTDSFVQMVGVEHTVDEYLDEPENVNNNDKIIEMSKRGMSTVDIARELGLGVGEVKLVIDLFKD